VKIFDVTQIQYKGDKKKFKEKVSFYSAGYSIKSTSNAQFLEKVFLGKSGLHSKYNRIYNKQINQTRTLQK